MLALHALHRRPGPRALCRPVAPLGGRAITFQRLAFLALALASLLAARTARGQSCTAPSFVNPRTDWTLAGDLNPQAVVVVDVNHDGKLDFVTANANTNSITVRLGNGDGTFGAPVSGQASAGQAPWALATADFNKDGNIDLAVSDLNVPFNSVSILLGDGTGRFSQASPATVSIDNGSQSIAVADFNRDGKPDFVAANTGANTVSIRLGNGDGSFTPAVPSSITVGFNPYEVVAGDFNRDGKPDFAALVSGAATDYLDVRYGIGDGTFAGPATITLPGTSVDSVVTADFNGDGVPDLAVANNDISLTTFSVYLILGKATGGFNPPLGPFPTGAYAQALAVGDFNGDGKPDLAVANGSGNATLSVLLNVGGGFGPPRVFATDGGPESAAVGDLNGDGRVDLATANSAGNDVSVLLNDFSAPCGNSSFGPAGRVSDLTGSGPIALARGQFDGTGTPNDLVVTNFNSNSLTILKGASLGGFTPPLNIPVGNLPRHTAVGFFNTDANMDLAVAESSTGTVRVLFGNGGAGFPTSASFAVGSNPVFVDVVDLTADGKPDLAVANNGSSNVSILRGDGGGGFTLLANVPVGPGSAPSAVADGDFNGDGRLDLAVADAALSVCHILLGNGAGGFSSVTDFPLGAGATDPESIVVADFNQDDVPDIATANFGSNNVSVLLGNGDGTFSLAGYSPLAVGNGPQSITAADFNGDGKADLATADKLEDRVSVLLGNGGGFSAATAFVAAGGPVAVVAGDFDGDGLLDLATANNSAQNVLVLRGDGLGGFAPPPRYGAGTSPRLLSTGDFNRDGILDLVVPTSANTVSLLLGDTVGGFALASSYPAGSNPQQAAVGDFNRDGILDLAVPNAGAASTSFSILLGSPTPPGGFGLPSTISISPQTNPRFIITGDFDQDGKLDLAVGHDPSNVRIFRGDGLGGFVPFWNLGVAGSPVFIAAGDFNGDGDPDLAVLNAVNNNVSIFTGRLTDAGFTSGATFAAGTKPVSIAVADFDGDGKLDLAVANENSDNVSLFKGNGAAGFTPFPTSPMAAGKLPKWVVAGDFNGDGKTDLAVANFTSRSVSVHLGRGDGSFDPFLVRAYGVGGEPVSLASGDFDRNGKTDLVASHILGDGVTVLLNTNCTARRLAIFTEVSSCDTPGSPFASQPILYVLDDGANLMQCDTGNNVSSSLLGGPGSLVGTTTKPTSAGVAIFDDLRVTAAGRGYRLKFSYPGVGTAESRSFSQGLSVNITGPTQMCAADPPTLFTAPLGYDKYDWALDSTPVSVTPRVLVFGLTPVPHSLQLSVLQDSCAAGDLHTIVVDDGLTSLTISPPGPFTVCQATGCFGPTFTESHSGGGLVAYQWGFRTVSGATEPVTSIPGQTGGTYLLSGPDFPGPGTYYVVLKVTPACGSPLVSNEVKITVDTSQPQDTVRFFTVTSTANTNTLEWIYPPGYSQVAIRYNSGPTSCSFPLTVSSGTPLPDQTGPAGGRDSFPHNGLTNGDHYCYTLFVDKGGVGTGPYSAGRSNQGRPFDSTTGPTKWAFSVGSTTLAPPGIGTDRIHVAVNDNSLHSALRGASGGTWPAAPWQPVPMNGPSQGRPSTVPITLGAASRVVFLGSQDKHVYAIDADTGAFVAPWFPVPDLGAMVQAAPSGMFSAFGGAYNYILIGTRDSANPNKFFVLNVSDGSTAYAVAGAPFGRIGIISGQAAVDYATRRVYFTSYAYGLAPDNNTAWCVNLSTGAVIWARPYGDIAAGPTLSRDRTRLYIGTNTGEVKALNTIDGAPTWSYPTGDGPVKGFVTIDRLSPTNDLYFSTTNKVWSLADSGGTPPTFRWARSLDNPSTPVFLTGSLHVYVGAGDGSLYRLSSLDGSDAPGLPATFPLVLGDGSAAVGSPTIDTRDGFVYVGTDAGVVYATQIP